MYEMVAPLSCLAKTSFEGFQKRALASGSPRATPASPNAPERASGVKFRNGTADVGIPRLAPDNVDWAKMTEGKKLQAAKRKREKLRFIQSVLVNNSDWLW